MILNTVDQYRIQLATLLGDIEGRILSNDVRRALGLPHKTLGVSLLSIGRAMEALGWKYCLLNYSGEPRAYYARGNTKNHLALVYDPVAEIYTIQIANPVPIKIKYKGRTGPRRSLNKWKWHRKKPKVNTYE